MRIRIARLLCVILSLIGFSSLVQSADGALKKASFIPLWFPQAQFAGYYVALDKGIYRKYGIDLTVLPGGSSYSAFEALREGKADFAALWLISALQRRAEGSPLVNVAQIVQHSSMLLVARKSSGISSVPHIHGKKVGVWGGDFAIVTRAFLEHHGLSVNAVPQSATVNLFLRGGVDVASAMRYNEYHTLLMSGLNEDELNVFALKDHGVDFPEDGLYAMQDTIERDPALVDAFVQASLEGWQYAFAHPEEALDVVLKYIRQAKLPASRTHQKWMLARMREVILPGSSHSKYGMLVEDDYLALGRELKRMNIVRDIPPYSVFSRMPHAGR